MKIDNKKDILDLVCKDCVEYHQSIKEMPDCTQCEYCKLKQYYKYLEEEKMKIDNFKHEDNWQDIKDSTMNTIGKNTGRYPDSEWKRKLILSEHSPIRRMKFYWRWCDLKSWVSVHFVRHKIGIEHWVTTQRSDRTGLDRDSAPQGALVNHAAEADAQALINISRKRLCKCASKETREAWIEVKKEVAKTEPELASCMVRECIYRGFCPEMNSCGYCNTDEFLLELEEYRYGVKKENK